MCFRGVVGGGSVLSSGNGGAVCRLRLLAGGVFGQRVQRDGLLLVAPCAGEIAFNVARCRQFGLHFAYQRRHFLKGVE